MKKIIIAAATIIFSWLGWWLGYQFNFFAAFILSMVGTGVGLYAGKQFTNMY